MGGHFALHLLMRNSFRLKIFIVFWRFDQVVTYSFHFQKMQTRKGVVIPFYTVGIMMLFEHSLIVISLNLEENISIRTDAEFFEVGYPPKTSPRRSHSHHNDRGFAWSTVVQPV